MIYLIYLYVFTSCESSPNISSLNIFYTHVHFLLDKLLTVS